MQITHQQARTLIQLSFDQILQSSERKTLEGHLHDCAECRTYANEIREVERLLVPAMRSWWSAQPIPLSTAVLFGKGKQPQTSTLLAIRKFAISLVLVAFVFGAWQLLFLGPAASTRTSTMIPPAPTPSVQTAQFTSTNDTCEMISYPMQENDTFAAIASRFLVSEEALRSANGLPSGEPVFPAQLVIPICNFTPTGTAHPATFTTTYTPSTLTTMKTPDG